MIKILRHFVPQNDKLAFESVILREQRDRRILKEAFSVSVQRLYQFREPKKILRHFVPQNDKLAFESVILREQRDRRILKEAFNICTEIGSISQTDKT